jgi:cysteine desulfurase / selenocysteine lyase
LGCKTIFWNSAVFSQLEPLLQKAPTGSALCISGVHWLQGFRLPLEEISTLTQKYGHYLLVDGSQLAGNAPINLDQSGIDAFYFSAWNWLLGPLGLGALWLSKKLQANLAVPFKGTESVKEPESYLPHRFQWVNDAHAWEYSTANYNDWVYFASSLELLSNIGFNNVQERLFLLRNKLAEAICKQDLFYETSTVPPHGQPTSIFTFKPCKGSPQELMQFLQKQNIVCALRGESIRFSPHLNILEEDVKQIAEVLNSFY